MKKDKKLLKWREAWKLNRRAFALIYKRCPHMIISRLVCVVWDSLTPYIGIYLSALLITELTQGRNPSVITNLVLIILLSAAFISLAAAFCTSGVILHAPGCIIRYSRYFPKK